MTTLTLIIFLTLIGCGDKAAEEPSAEEVEASCQRAELGRFAFALEQISEMTEACSYMQNTDPTMLVACTNMPAYPYSRPFGLARCEDFRATREAADDWIHAVAPALAAACKADAGCQAWRHGYSPGSPAWWEIRDNE